MVESDDQQQKNNLSNQVSPLKESIPSPESRLQPEDLSISSQRQQKDSEPPEKRSPQPTVTRQPELKLSVRKLLGCTTPSPPPPPPRERSASPIDEPIRESSPEIRHNSVVIRPTTTLLHEDSSKGER